MKPECGYGGRFAVTLDMGYIISPTQSKDRLQRMWKATTQVWRPCDRREIYYAVANFHITSCCAVTIVEDTISTAHQPNTSLYVIPVAWHLFPLFR